MKLKKAAILALALVYIPAILVVFAHYAVTDSVIYSDGIGYYVYSRSIIVDHDVNFANDFNHYANVTSKFSGIPLHTGMLLLDTGYTDNTFLMGNGIMWSPFVLTAHMVTSAASSFGADIASDGFSWPYEFAVAFATQVYSLFAIVLLYSFTRKFYDQTISLLATIGFWLGSSIFWYQAVEPSISHINSILVAGAFVYLWYVTRGSRTTTQWIFLGLLGGLMYLIRQQDVILFVLPALEGLEHYWNWFKVKQYPQIVTLVRNHFIFGMVALLSLLPQILIWKITHDKFWVYSYTNSPYYWTFPQLLPFFFNFRAGLLWQPTLLLSIIGLFIFTKHNKKLAIYFLIALALQILLTSSWSDWENGVGLRFILGNTITYVVGFAALLHALRARTSMLIAIALVAVLILINAIALIWALLFEVLTKMSLPDIMDRLISFI